MEAYRTDFLCDRHMDRSLISSLCLVSGKKGRRGDIGSLSDTGAFCRGRLCGNYGKESGKELFLTGLIRELNLAEEMEFVREEKNGRAEILYLKEAEGERIKIAFVTESTDTEYQYVHILYEIENNVEQLLQYKTKIERLLKMRNLTATSNLNLKGSRNGKMSLNEKKEITDRLFQSLNASVVEAVREEDLYTVYGYSDLLQNSFSYGENEINLNLAFSYQEEAAKTVFYLAMPYVQMDY